MDDNQIVSLFWARSEDAIAAAAKKYGAYCHTIAYRILRSHEDAEECVNDAYLKVWQRIPPERPERLALFLGRITRNLSLHCWERSHAQKRGHGRTSIALDELSECLPAPDSVEQALDDITAAEALNRFLAALSFEARKIFLRRYWYFDTIKEIAADYGLSESKVKMTLLRTRNELREYLEKEGIY